LSEELEGGNPLGMSPDIFDKAKYVVSRIIWNSHWPTGNESEVRSVVRVEIHNAKMEERERCALLAETFVTKESDRGLLDDFGVGRDSVVREIAEAIRRTT